ncbi:MAG: RNA polymerase sigma-70 factor [Chloroflexia bacterium]|nr:RNA polymerase sigma-70 factor [Chloroflexia bacterium]
MIVSNASISVEVIKKIQQGNVEAFQTLFNYLFPSISSFAGKIVNDNEVGEDIAQDVFLKLWERKESYDNITSIKSFLYQIARNECLNFLKHKRVKMRHLEHEMLFQSHDDFLRDVIREEVHRKIYYALEKLPAKSKEIMNLNIQGLSNKEIAEDLNLSVNTVKTLKIRSYKMLRVILRNLYSLFF